MKTLQEIIEGHYREDRNYKKEVEDFYRGAKGLDLQDKEDILIALDVLGNEGVQGAVDYLQGRDTEVREVFSRMMVNDERYDWNGNRK